MTRLEENPAAIDPLDEAYALAPPVELPPQREVAALREKFEPLNPAPSTPVREKEPAQFNDPARFTLRNLLLVITLASVVLAIGVRFPRAQFAGAAGLAALVTAVAASWKRGSGAVMQLAWWTLLGIYLMACAFALVGL